MPRQPYPATASQIARWVPESSREIAGNQNLVNYCSDSLKVEGKVAPTLIVGASRSGKTATIKLMINTLFCERTDGDSEGPCLECVTCRTNVAQYGQLGLDAQLRTDKKTAGRMMPLHFIPIDCTSHTESTFRDKMLELKDFDDGLRLIFLDEFHRLARRGLDEMLLKPLEEKNFAWWASCVTTQGLDQMLLNRFCVRIRTQAPTVDALAEWLARRCHAWQLQWDDPTTLISLAERSSLIPGHALHALARAATAPDRMLTRAMVENHCFDGT